MANAIKQHGLRTVIHLALLSTLTVVLATCAPRVSLLHKVETLGTLRVALINSATSYFMRAEGAAGFEYDLVHRFADNLGLELEIINVGSRREAMQAVLSDRAHMAAGLAISRTARKRVHFTPAYSTIALDVVYNTHNEAPDNLTDLNGRLTLRAHSALSDKLTRLRPGLTFRTRNHSNVEALMAAVAEQRIYATIASDDLVSINQRYYPELRIAFTLSDIKRTLAWAFPKNKDQKLYNKAVAWLAHAVKSGQVDVLHQRYFAHADRLGFLGGRILSEQIRKRLPQWRPLFKRAADKYGLDWRLLAAMSYQESHWKPDAVSPTGVRGLMMLTQTTAKELDVSNRLNPEQSIDGGARYLVHLRKRLPDSIKEPDRTWMAMAAYNIGFGHLMDARRLLKTRDKNPNLWANVRTGLTWLTKEQYFNQTRYGYAHGYQAVEYVGNIRAYYDILRWKTDDNKGAVQPKVATQAPAPRPASRQSDAGAPTITIDSSAL